MSVKECVIKEAGQCISRYTRISPLAGTFAVVANEQHVVEVSSTLIWACVVDGLADAWIATIDGRSGNVDCTASRAIFVTGIAIGSPGFTSIVDRLTDRHVTNPVNSQVLHECRRTWRSTKRAVVGVGLVTILLGLNRDSWVYAPRKAQGVKRNAVSAIGISQSCDRSSPLASHGRGKNQYGDARNGRTIIVESNAR